METGSRVPVDPVPLDYIVNAVATYGDAAVIVVPDVVLRDCAGAAIVYSDAVDAVAGHVIANDHVVVRGFGRQYATLSAVADPISFEKIAAAEVVHEYTVFGHLINFISHKCIFQRVVQVYTVFPVVTDFVSGQGVQTGVLEIDAMPAVLIHAVLRQRIAHTILQTYTDFFIMVDFVTRYLVVAGVQEPHTCMDIIVYTVS